jgi:two-component system C4-dicarboxylate transport response regulator DctD
MSGAPVLIVEDDLAVREALAQSLELAGLSPITAGSFVAAKDHIVSDFAGVVLSDIRMPGRDGFHLLSYALEQDADLPVILLTGEGDIPMAVKAMGQGAFDFLEKPCAPADLIAVLERAIKTRELVLENRRLRMQLETGDAAARMLFGTSDLAEVLRTHVRRVAQTQTEVLVTGAPGTGVSKVAEVIHLSSALSKGPFVKRASSGLDRAGLSAALEAARNGSLFIDEIAALPADSQIALIEAMDEGATTRVIAGSTADLTQASNLGQINADLFYRFQVMTVRIPSLAERPEDIPILFRHYVAQASEQAGLTAPDITPQVIAALLAQDWPGNARALMSAAMRFALGFREELAPTASSDLGLNDQMSQVEHSLLVAALQRAGGQASVAAQDLKLPRKTFYDKLAKHGIRAEAFRNA